MASHSLRHVACAVLVTAGFTVGCGDTATTTTVTVTKTGASSVAGTTPSASVAPRNLSSKSKAFTHCDTNIEAKTGTTSCPFAQNVFLEYYASREAETIKAYSPTRKKFFSLRCVDADGRVRCATFVGGVVKFPVSAIAAYTDQQAAAYIANSDVGPGPRPSVADQRAGGSTTTTPEPDPDITEPDVDITEPDAPVTDTGAADFCDTHDCIPNYDEGNGTTVRCKDGTYSQSGGIQGACSHHGGVG